MRGQSSSQLGDQLGGHLSGPDGRPWAIVKAEIVKTILGVLLLLLLDWI